MKIKIKAYWEGKDMHVFVAHDGSTAVLGMQDIDRLGMLSINLKSNNRQVAEEDNMTIVRVQGKLKATSLNSWNVRSRKQKHKTHRMPTYNPTVMGNNNKGSIASLSELLISQNLIADAERKDDTTTIDLQTNCNNIDPFSEVLNNQNLITGTETKEDWQQ